MSEIDSDSEREAYVTWYKTMLDLVVQEMVQVKAIEADGVEAKPAWALPHKVLIGQLRKVGQPKDFIWVIAGEGVSTDHIDGQLASTPREAARYFAMKWHMDAQRLEDLSDKNEGKTNPELDMKEYAGRLVQHAESLYELVNADELWKQVSLND